MGGLYRSSELRVLDVDCEKLRMPTARSRLRADRAKIGRTRALLEPISSRSWRHGPRAAPSPAREGPVSGDPTVVRRTCPGKTGQCPSNACTIGRIGFGAIGDVALLNGLGGRPYLAGCIFEQRLALSSIHLPKEVPRLLIVVVVDAMVPVRRCALDRERRLVELWGIRPFALAVGVVAGSSSEITIRAHGAVAMIAVKRTLGRVNGYVIEVDAQTIALRVAVRE